MLLLPPWHSGGHRCSELSGSPTQTAVPLPKLAILFGFPAKSINQARSGQSVCARTVKSPHGAPVSTKTNLYQAPPSPPAAESRQQTLMGPICRTYATATRSGSPHHHVTAGKGHLPGFSTCTSPIPFQRLCAAFLPVLPRQPQPPSPTISFLCLLPPSSHIKHTCISRAAFILQVKNQSS